MRKVRLIYDCFYCGRQAIFAESLETELPDAELKKRVAHDAVCNNPSCPERGKKQEAMFPRVVGASEAAGVGASRESRS